MKKNIGEWALIACAAFLLVACGQTETPNVVCGSDWIKNHAAVVDTGSVFRISDPLVIQFRYGKAFDFGELEWNVYKGTFTQKNPAPVLSRTARVSDKEGSYTIQGVSLRGGLMTAGELLRSTDPGDYVIEFSVSGKVIAAKEMKLIRNSDPKPGDAQ